MLPDNRWAHSTVSSGFCLRAAAFTIIALLRFTPQYRWDRKKERVKSIDKRFVVAITRLGQCVAARGARPATAADITRPRCDYRYSYVVTGLAYLVIRRALLVNSLRASPAAPAASQSSLSSLWLLAFNWLSQRLSAPLPAVNVTSTLHNPPHSSDPPRGTKMPIFSQNNGEFKTRTNVLCRGARNLLNNNEKYHLTLVWLLNSLSGVVSSGGYLSSARRDASAPLDAECSPSGQFYKQKECVVCVHNPFMRCLFPQRPGLGVGRTGRCRTDSSGHDTTISISFGRRRCSLIRASPSDPV